jgi:aspartate-semialdehyde dehydrogenase
VTFLALMGDRLVHTLAVRTVVACKAEVYSWSSESDCRTIQTCCTVVAICERLASNSVSVGTYRAVSGSYGSLWTVLSCWADVASDSISRIGNNG